jgi:HPt (histidine-containing phosphotransfer) domain-containing protein
MGCTLEKVDWVADLIPDLESRIGPYVVDSAEMDDELTGIFIAELRRLTGELQAGVSSNDAEIMRAAAHSIKGMGGMIGLPEISVLGLDIENGAKENRISDVVPLVTALEDWLESL